MPFKSAHFNEAVARRLVDELGIVRDELPDGGIQLDLRTNVHKQKTSDEKNVVVLAINLSPSIKRQSRQGQRTAKYSRRMGVDQSVVEEGLRATAQLQFSDVVQRAALRRLYIYSNQQRSTELIDEVDEHSKRAVRRVLLRGSAVTTLAGVVSTFSPDQPTVSRIGLPLACVGLYSLRTRFARLDRSYLFRRADDFVVAAMNETTDGRNKTIASLARQMIRLEVNPDSPLWQVG